MAIARYYVADNNPDESGLPGVPLADIDEETFNSYPEWLRQSIDDAPFYRKTRPGNASKRERASSDDTAKE